jgi:putative endopeptidase
VSAFRNRLQRLDWMGPDTRGEAIRKLDTYVIKIGYPEHSRDYAALVIADDDLAGNVRRAAAFDWSFQLRRLSSAVDRTEWLVTPQSNEMYNGNLNDIVFPAASLQAPLYDSNADEAVNYGALGAIIGHELTHGFDDYGRELDASHALRDWWSKEDDAEFKRRAQRLVAQFSAYRPIPTDAQVHVKGEFTLGENIADLGGLSLALDAYHASLKGKPAPVIDGFTGEQRVFLGWAQGNRGKATNDYLKKQVVTDPHSPDKFRVNGVVRNMDAWYSAFSVGPGNLLYLAPEDRVRIW